MQLQSLNNIILEGVQFSLDNDSFQFRNSFLTSSLMKCSLWSCVCSCNRLKILVALILAVSWMKAQNHHRVKQKRPDSLADSYIIEISC